MIVDRRLVAAIVVTALVIVVVLVATDSQSSPGATSATTVAAPATPISRSMASSSAVNAVHVGSPVPSLAPPRPPGAARAAVPTLPADRDVVQLVRARRPVPDAARMDVDDGHGDNQAGHSTASAGEVAASTAVAMWSWRFDDSPTRLADALASVATSEIIAELAPASAELDRRRAGGEVAWALVTPAPTRADPDVPGEVVVEVTGRQHVTTATTAETVVGRAASVRLRAVTDGWQVVDVVQS